MDDQPNIDEELEIGSNFNFFYCDNCLNLMLYQSSKIELQNPCPSCSNDKVNKVDFPFILSCTECFEYWPKRTIHLISDTGLCHCPKDDCAGALKIRYKEDNVVPSNKLSEIMANKLKKAVIQNDHEIIDTDSKEQESSVDIQSFDQLSIQPIINISSLDSSNRIDSIQIDEILQRISSLIKHTDIAISDFKYIIPYQRFNAIFSSLIRIQSRSLLVPEVDVQSVIYIGNLIGNLTYMCYLTHYINRILASYPNHHFVFLGNYFNNTINDFIILALIGCLKIRYPQKITLLKSSSDFPVEYGGTSNIQNIYTDLKKLYASEISISEKLLISNFSLFQGVLSYLSLFQVTSLSKQQVRIFATHSAFPFDDEQITMIEINQIEEIVKNPILSLYDLPKSLEFAFIANPSLDQLESGTHFSKELYFRFLKANDLRYMVRTHNSEINRYIYQDLICNLYSSLDLGNELYIKFNASADIVRLKAGKSPDVINIESELFNDLESTYGLS